MESDFTTATSSLSAFPDELHYAKTHEWLQVDENLVTVGLTSVILSKIGEVLYVDLPEDGQKLSQGQIFGTVESVLHVHDLVSPVAGTVIEVNASVVDDPSLISDRPYGDGWLIRIEMDNENDLARMVRSKEYAGLTP